MPAVYGAKRPDLDATATPSDIEIAWAAGVYEGEGSCSRVAIREGTWALNVHVGQRDLWLLERLRVLFGGSIHRRPNIGDWHIHGTRAEEFLLSIFSFLSPRRQGQIVAAVAGRPSAAKFTITIDPQ